jgi:hypothetical protein
MNEAKYELTFLPARTLQHLLATLPPDAVVRPQTDDQLAVFLREPETLEQIAIIDLTGPGVVRWL